MRGVLDARSFPRSPGPAAKGRGVGFPQSALVFTITARLGGGTYGYRVEGRTECSGERRRSES